MESHEVLKNAIEKAGAKAIASDMNLSVSLIYKWCQSRDYNVGAADNPLDRLFALYQLTKDDSLVRWLCQKADGYFVKNPVKEGDVSNAELFALTQKILTEFSEMLQAISISTANDGQITKREATQIRREWDQMKSITENFVKACEDGAFQFKK